MRHYEVVVVLSPMLNQEQATEAWGRVKNFINNRNGDITHEEKWGTRRLAYPIRKGQHHFLEGSYHLTRFSTERPFNRELETFLRLDEEILRSLVVATEPPGPAPRQVGVVVVPTALETTAVAPVATAAATEVATALATAPIEIRTDLALTPSGQEEAVPTSREGVAGGEEVPTASGAEEQGAAPAKAVKPRTPRRKKVDT